MMAFHWLTDKTRREMERHNSIARHIIVAQMVRIALAPKPNDTAEKEVGDGSPSDA